MKRARIDAVAEFVLDGTHGSPARTEGGIPVLSAQNVAEGQLDFGTDRYTTPAEYESFQKRLPLRMGDVLLTIVGTIGRAAVIDRLRPIVFQRSVAVIRPKPSVLLPRFLFYVSQSHEFQAQLSRASNQSAQAGVYLGKLKELLVPLPPIDEQRRIASILDKADAIRRKRQQALGVVCKLAESAFMGLFGDPVRNPRRWPAKSLVEVSQIQSGVAKGKHFEGQPTVSVPYMRVANVQDGVLCLDQVKTIEALPSDVERLRLLPGDVLLTEGGDPDKLGRGAIWRGEVDSCIHQNHIFRVRANRECVLPDYLNALIGSRRGKSYFLRAAKQTTGIATINRSQLDAFPVLLPPVRLQEEYAALASRTRRVERGYENAWVECDSLFFGLSSRYLQ